MPQPFDSIDITGLDFEKGLNVFEGEMDDYIAALQSFIKNTPAMIEKLCDVSKDNLSEYAINIHGLKSVSAWICAENIRKGAAELDAFAKAGDIAAIIARNDMFLKEVNSFLQELGTELEKKSEG